jgi:hypothetical protein
VRLLHRLGPAVHRREIDDLAVIFCDVLRPDPLHCLDLLAHLEGAGLVYGAVIFHLFGIPAAADAEQEAALRYLVQRSDKLGRLDRVALDNEVDGCAQLEAGSDARRRAKRDERVHHVKVLLGQRRFALRMGKPAGDRNVRMFRHPERVETTLFERHRKLGRRYRVVGEEDRSTDFHVPTSQIASVSNLAAGITPPRCERAVRVPARPVA